MNENKKFSTDKVIYDIKEKLLATKESINSNKTEKSISEKPLNKRIKNWIIILVALFVVGSVIFTISQILPDRAGKFETTAEATLKEILNIGELSTLEYVYNGVATAYADEKEEKIKYYVAYEGTVKVGIDAEQIAINIDDSEKKITIHIPEIKINNISLKQDTPKEYIFLKKKYEKEDVIKEADEICKADLEKRVNEDVEIKEFAYDNTVNTIKAFISPIVVQLENEYTVEVQ